jgi:hypothetical protein
MMGISKATVADFDTKNPPEALSPIAHLFICFNDDGRKTWAIRKIYFDRWKLTGKVSKKSTGRPPKWKTDSTYTNLNIPIKKDLKDRFYRMVDNANAVSSVKISYRDMIYVAMEECMARRPQFLGGGENASK